MRGEIVKRRARAGRAKEREKNAEKEVKLRAKQAVKNAVRAAAAAEKQKKRDSDAEKAKVQHALIASLLERKVDKRKDNVKEHSAYVNELAQLVADGAVKKSNVYHLSSMSERHFGKIANNLIENKRHYEGRGVGRPAHMTKESKLELSEFLLRRRLGRDSLKPEVLRGIVQNAVSKSLANRGLRTPPKNDKFISAAYTRNLMKECGVNEKMTQFDNEQRTRALQSGRNPISNFSGLLALADAEFTCDKRDVHPGLRGNLDAVSVYLQKGPDKADKAVVVC